MAVGGASGSARKPSKRPGDEGLTALLHRLAMGHDNPAGRPVEDAPQRRAAGAAVDEGGAKLPGRRGFRRGHQVQARNQRPPAPEPARRKLLQQIGEQRRAAGSVEEDHLGGDAVAQHYDLIEIAGTLIRAALPSHECVARNLLFSEGDSCRINLATVQWFEGQIVAADKV